MVIFGLVLLLHFFKPLCYANIKSIYYSRFPTVRVEKTCIIFLRIFFLLTKLNVFEVVFDFDSNAKSILHCCFQ